MEYDPQYADGEGWRSLPMYVYELRQAFWPTFIKCHVGFELKIDSAPFRKYAPF